MNAAADAYERAVNAARRDWLDVAGLAAGLLAVLGVLLW